MNIALIGATGFVGKAILKELLERGHHVTAIVRHPENVQVHEHIVTKSANVLHSEEVAEAIKGQDAVISAYNAGWSNPNLYQEFLQGSAAIEEGLRKAGVKRLLVIGGAGSLYLADGVQLVDSPQFPKEWRAGAEAARDYLAVLQKEQALDWTFLSPAIEMHQGTSGNRTGHYRTALDNPVFNDAQRSFISVEDLAVAVVDEIEHPKHIRRRFTVGY